MITAIDIQTEKWNGVLEYFILQRWKVAYKYDAFDAGIDFDLIVLTKNNEFILFGWNNWFEGEIQCSELRMKEIEQFVGHEFTKGEPENLKDSVVSIYWQRP
jgi:hypothetical protein